MKLKLELSTLERERQKKTLKIQKEQLALQKKQAELQREREKEQLEFQREREREQLELQREREQEALKIRERERKLQREHAEKQAAIALQNRRKELDLETTHHTQRKEAEANLQFVKEEIQATDDSDDVSHPVLVTTRAQSVLPQPAALSASAVPQDSRSLPPSLTMLEFHAPVQQQSSTSLGPAAQPQHPLGPPYSSVPTLGSVLETTLTPVAPCEHPLSQPHSVPTADPVLQSALATLDLASDEPSHNLLGSPLSLIHSVGSSVQQTCTSLSPGVLPQHLPQAPFSSVPAAYRVHQPAPTFASLGHVYAEYQHLLYPGLRQRRRQRALQSPLGGLFHFNSTGQTRTCFRCGAKGHVAAGCDAPRAEAPSVFLEDDFLRLSVHGDYPTDPRSVQVPGVVPAAVPAVTPSGPDLSAPPVSSGDLWAPALDLRRSVDVKVHPHPVASVVALDGAVRVAAASPAEEHVLVGAVVSMTPPMPSASSPLVVSSLTRASSPLPVPSPSLDTSRVLESNLPPAVSLPSPNPVSLDGSGFLPCVVEAAVLRGRAAPALGPPADGSFGAPLVGGDSSDDQRPISMRRRSARDASPHRTWAEERDAMDDDAVGGDVLPSVLDTVPPAGGSPQWAVVPCDRDLVVVLSKVVRQGYSAPVPVGRGPEAPAVPPSAGLGAMTGIEL
ncbi:uncharacterized protein [Procambarus clarkii]|uniref:uncharacterized protein n=1 Tax=Procambarus clarkii TaxID=6728 RepID=UPI003742BF8E